MVEYEQTKPFLVRRTDDHTESEQDVQPLSRDLSQGIGLALETAVSEPLGALVACLDKTSLHVKDNESSLHSMQEAAQGITTLITNLQQADETTIVRENQRFNFSFSPITRDSPPPKLPDGTIEIPSSQWDKLRMALVHNVGTNLTIFQMYPFLDNAQECMEYYEPSFDALTQWLADVKSAEQVALHTTRGETTMQLIIPSEDEVESY